MTITHYHSRAEVLMDRVIDAVACGHSAEMIVADVDITLAGLEKCCYRAGRNDLGAWFARARRRAA